MAPFRKGGSAEGGGGSMFRCIFFFPSLSRFATAPFIQRELLSWLPFGKGAPPAGGGGSMFRCIFFFPSLSRSATAPFIQREPLFVSGSPCQYTRIHRGNFASLHYLEFGSHEFRICIERGPVSDRTRNPPAQNAGSRPVQLRVLLLRSKSPRYIGQSVSAA